MVNVEAPGLTIESFGDGVLDAGEADCMGASRAGCHCFKGCAREAAFTFEQSVGCLSFVFVEGCG